MMLYQALYRVTIRSYAELQHAFLVHHQVGPTEADIMKHDRVDTRIERPRPPSAPQIPFFIAQLRLLPDRIEVEPLEDILKMIFHRITGLILETVMDIAAFTTDPIFVQYTQWVILCIDCDYILINPFSDPRLWDGRRSVCITVRPIWPRCSSRMIHSTSIGRV